ncbi:MAG: DMT family transporter [Rhodoplanes sp.]|uniref:DMT family transporter n=1 Tax=Rhodoplanes sp. TaxID=1968906 RepID=UPI00182E6E76|nr:DMT family transporter [Rhodoplanes sp.]NVO13547.1 DMT family transporter [Rhodoplanes sp.]
MPKRSVLSGILFMVGATVMFSVGGAVSKWQLVTYPIGEILAVRAFVSLVTVAIIILPRTGLAVFRTNRLRDHGTRSLTQAAAQTCIMVALSLLPFASVIAVNFSAPLFATLFSALFFHEAAGRARWAALVAGFAGVLIVTHPGADTFQIGFLFAIGNAVLYGVVTAGVRSMTKTESAGTLTMWQMVMLTGIFTAALPFGFVVPTVWDGVLMLFNGVSNAVGQYWWTRSLHLAPAGAVGPFYYLSLVWAMAIGFLVWGDVPTVHLVVGSVVVVTSGLALLWHESSRRS